MYGYRTRTCNYEVLWALKTATIHPSPGLTYDMLQGPVIMVGLKSHQLDLTPKGVKYSICSWSRIRNSIGERTNSKFNVQI